MAQSRRALVASGFGYEFERRAAFNRKLRAAQIRSTLRGIRDRQCGIRLDENHKAGPETTAGTGRLALVHRCQSLARSLGVIGMRAHRADQERNGGGSGQTPVACAGRQTSGPGRNDLKAITANLARRLVNGSDGERREVRDGSRIQNLLDGAVSFTLALVRVILATSKPKEALIKALEIRGRLKSGGGSRKSPISRSKCAKVLPFAAVQCASEGHFRPPDTLRPQKGQPLAVLVEIHQCEGRQ